MAIADLKTPVTNLNLDTVDQGELLKHDAAAVTALSTGGGNTFAAITNCDGWYNLTLTAGNVDTRGMLLLVLQDVDVCGPVSMEFMVLDKNAYDEKYGVSNKSIY